MPPRSGAHVTRVKGAISWTSSYLSEAATLNRWGSQTSTVGAIVQVILGVIVPVFIVIAAGFSIQKFISVETRSISNLILYAFTPCLVFVLIVNSSLQVGEWLGVTIVAVVSTLVLVAVSWAASRAFHLKRELMSAMILSSSFVNAGNYGMPLSLFAFGEKGLELAVIFYIVGTLLSFTVGVFIACRGRYGFSESVASVLRLPLIYALIAAVAVRLGGFNLPQGILRGLNLMGQAAIPAMLILLGVELARSTSKRADLVNLKWLGLSSGIKLLFPIFFVSQFAVFIGLRGLASSVALVQASMPTAVYMAVITTKYGGNSRFVTSGIVMSTLASIVTLTLLLSYLI